MGSYKDRIVEHNGQRHYYNDAVQYMLDDIREELHSWLAPCTDQAFFDAYLAEHLKRTGEDFAEGLYPLSDWR